MVGFGKNRLESFLYRSFNETYLCDSFLFTFYHVSSLKFLKNSLTKFLLIQAIEILFSFKVFLLVKFSKVHYFASLLLI